MNRLFAIGDIHGCYDKLRALMDKIPIDFASDTLIFMGDYIDRGPDSYEVVEYLVDLKTLFPGIIFLKGNHEEMLEKYLSGGDRVTYLLNGGQQTLDSYFNQRRLSEDSPFPAEHLTFFKSLQLYYETDDFIFAHAGLRQRVSIEKQKRTDLLWIREKFIYTKYNFGKKVIFGHTPFPKPLVESNKIGIDTGAVYGNLLTCVQLPDVDFFSV